MKCANAASIGASLRKINDTSFLNMKTSNHKDDSQKLAGTVQLARLRLATAENLWKTAKVEARMAKRRRKEAKLMARRAKNQARLAKEDLAEARKALAEAEAKFAKPGARVAAKKRAQAKPRPAVNVVTTATKKKATPAGKSQTVLSVPALAPESAAQVALASLTESAPSLVPAQARSVNKKPNGGTPEPAVNTGTAAAESNPATK